MVTSPDNVRVITKKSKSDNKEIVTGFDTNEIIEELFDPFSQRYQEGLEKSIKDNDFVFDFVDGLHYKYHKVSLNRGGSYIDSCKWLKKQKATTNPKSNDTVCFKHVEMVEPKKKKKMERDPQRIPKIEPYIDLYNWKDIDFPARSKD